MLIRKNNRIVVKESAEDKDSLNKELLKACSRTNRDVDEVKSLLEEGADPNIKDRDGDTPLHKASSLGRTDVVKVLLDAGAAINVRNNFEWAPLYYASRYGRTDVVKLLLEAGADPNIKNNYGETPLHEASDKLEVVIATLLLDAGADPNIKDNYGETPLHNALSVYRGYTAPELIKLLLEAGADPNIKNNSWESPIDIVKRQRDKNILLLFLPYILDDIEDLNEEDENGDTWLSRAIQEDNLRFAKELIREGADINHISVRRAYMDRRYRNNETAKYVEDLVNKPKKKSKFDF